jgi:hypothetical protein
LSYSSQLADAAYCCSVDMGLSKWLLLLLGVFEPVL